MHVSFKVVSLLVIPKIRTVTKVILQELYERFHRCFLFFRFQLQLQFKSLHEQGIEPKVMQDGRNAVVMQFHAIVLDHLFVSLDIVSDLYNPMISTLEIYIIFLAKDKGASI